jgi:IS1 family transposase
MNRLPLEKRLQILTLLVEGTSMRAITRITGASLNTISKLLAETGDACLKYHNAAMRVLPCKNIQIDELWSFVYAKSKNLPAGKEGGSVWTFVAIDADTRLVPSWHCGTRSVPSTRRFLLDLASRIAGRFQITSDGWRPYTDGVAITMGDNVDYAQIVKLYGPDKNENAKGAYTGADIRVHIGQPEPKKVSTTYVERQNLTMRTSIKRFARETNAHSKKMENHEHSVALHFFYYNFVRVHGTLKKTPAMAAGIIDRPMTFAEILL